MSVRTNLIKDAIRDWEYYMVQEYLVKQGVEHFYLFPPSNRSSMEDYDLTTQEFEWIKENYDYTVDEYPGQYCIEKHFKNLTVKTD
ncbi:MAG: hypothetical protein AAFO07_32250 [Bacteroidota bacterium]